MISHYRAETCPGCPSHIRLFICRGMTVVSTGINTPKRQSACSNREPSIYRLFHAIKCCWLVSTKLTHIFLTACLPTSLVKNMIIAPLILKNLSIDPSIIIHEAVMHFLSCTSVIEYSFIRNEIPKINHRSTYPCIKSCCPLSFYKLFGSRMGKIDIARKLPLSLIT